MKKQTRNQKLVKFIKNLKDNGANFNEAFLEVSEYQHDTEEALEILDQVYQDENEENKTIVIE